MSDGRRKQAWVIASCQMALLFNCHRDPAKTALANAEDFNPYAKRRGAAVMIAPRDFFQMLCGMPGVQRVDNVAWSHPGRQ